MTFPRSFPSADALLYGLTLALAASLPFESIHPLASVAGLELNQLKLLLLATAVAWLLSRRRPLLDARTLWPIGLFLALAGLSAVTAPAGRPDALKFVARLASGLYALVLVRTVTTSSARLHGVLWAIVLGAGSSAALGLGEAVGWHALDPVLATFKLAPTRVGGGLRVSASFQYATIAAMFFELATPLAIVLAASAQRRAARLAATGVALLSSTVVVLTVTRAGLAALVLAFGLLLGLAWARPRWRPLALPTALATASATLAFLLLAARDPAFDTRLATENDWGWYAATYDVPAALTMAADAPTEATVVARNTGEATWTMAGDHPFALAYRWLSADAVAQLAVSFSTVDLPRDVPPGQAVQLRVPLAADLPAGDYRLAWGMLQREVLWFHDRGYPDAETAVHVPDGARPQAAPPVAEEPRSDTGTGLAPVPRLQLWRAALQMIAQRPWLGIGPDNFRHTYGAYLDLPSWDERVHANNLYLELLADLGLLGSVSFTLILLRPILGLVRGLRAPVTVVQGLWLAGLSASLLAFFVHGTLDYFLEFTPVSLLFWLIVGLAMAAPELEPC